MGATIPGVARLLQPPSLSIRHRPRVVISSGACRPCKEIHVQKLLASGGLALSVALIAACMTTSPGLGDDAGNAALPTGISLLGSDEDDCGGALLVSEDGIDGEGDGPGDAFEVDPGENATFRLDGEDEEVAWACVDADGDSDEESMECPSGTTHVRVTRAASGGELLVECYG